MLACISSLPHTLSLAAAGLAAPPAACLTLAPEAVSSCCRAGSPPGLAACQNSCVVTLRPTSGPRACFCSDHKHEIAVMQGPLCRAPPAAILFICLARPLSPAAGLARAKEGAGGRPHPGEVHLQACAGQPCGRGRAEQGWGGHLQCSAHRRRGGQAAPGGGAVSSVCCSALLCFRGMEYLLLGAVALICPLC